MNGRSANFFLQWQLQKIVRCLKTVQTSSSSQRTLGT